MIKKGVKNIFENRVVKNYILPFVDAITKDAISGTSPPNLLEAIGKVIEGRIWDKFTAGPKKLLGYLDKSSYVDTACPICHLLLLSLFCRIVEFNED